MSRRLLNWFCVAAAISVAACADAPTSPPTTEGPVGVPAAPSAPAPSVVGIAISPESVSVALGATLTLTTYKVMSNGSKVLVPFPSFAAGPLPPHYTAGFSTAVSVNSVSGVVSAVAPGLARVQVTYEGMTAFSTIHVREPVASNSVALKVEAFAVIEYSPSGQGWFYAPQLTVSAPTSTSVTILTVRFNVPGWPYPNSLPWNCGGHIPALSQQALNGEVYGSWTWEMFSPGHRANGDDIKAVITFIDGTGNTGIVEVHGRVVQGDWPETYTGGVNGGACYHGYRGGGS